MCNKKQLIVEYANVQVNWPMAFESGNPTDVMFMEVSCDLHLSNSAVLTWYADGIGNTVEENSNVLSLI